MSLQRSVSQQNHEVLEKIQRGAGSLANYSWLPSLLVERGQNVEEGILVQIGSGTEQEGDEIFGVWLSSEKEFWEFSVIISRETGYSFGYLALQAAWPAPQFKLNQNEINT